MSRRCSGLLHGPGQRKLAHVACVLRLLPRDSQRSRLLACFTRGSRVDEHDRLSRDRRARATALAVYGEEAERSSLSRARAVPH